MVQMMKPQTKATHRLVGEEEIMSLVVALAGGIDRSIWVWIETSKGVRHREGDWNAPVTRLIALAKLNREIRLNASLRTHRWGRRYETAVERFNERLECVPFRMRGFDPSRGMECLMDNKFPLRYRNSLLADLLQLQKELVWLNRMGE